MFSTTLTLTSNNIAFELINKEFNHFFIHQFTPNYYTDFYLSDIKNKYLQLEDTYIRRLHFDISADLNLVQKLLKINVPYLNIYQFNKIIPNSLIIENLNENVRDTILKQNGLQHKYFINNEFLSIYSFDKQFIDAIEENPNLKPFIL